MKLASTDLVDHDGTATPRSRISQMANAAHGQMLTVLGTAMVFAWIGVAAAAPLITPFQPTTADPASTLLGPSHEHWFGTDGSGMDIFSRTIFAARIDLAVALGGTGLAFLVGVPLGLLAGFHRGWGSETLVRLAEVIQSFPILIVAMAFVTLTGGGIPNIILAIALLNIPLFLRLVRVSVLALREQSFVEAAICAGNSDTRLLLRHLLPNVLSGAVAQASVSVGWAILLTAGLSFVGIGIRVPTPEWGSMVSLGAQNMTTGEWWVALFPGLAIALTVLAFHVMGDGVQDLLDPRK